MQKSLKIRSRISSVYVAPMISPRLSSAPRRSRAMNSGERPDVIDSSAFCRLAFVCSSAVLCRWFTAQTCSRELIVPCFTWSEIARFRSSSPSPLRHDMETCTTRLFELLKPSRKVRLVDDRDHVFALHLVHHAPVLGSKRLGTIENEKHDVGGPDGRDASAHALLLHDVMGMPDAGGIQNFERHTRDVQIFFKHVTRRPRDLVHDRPVLLQKRV